MTGFAILVVASVALPAVAPGPDKDTLETEIHEEINDRRQARGLTALTHNERMSGYAANYSERMAKNDFFAHTPPSKPPKQQVRCGITGENLVSLSKTSGEESELAAEVVNTWMRSEQHRNNILQTTWRAQGIGVAFGDELIVTQRFCG